MSRSAMQRCATGRTPCGLLFVGLLVACAEPPSPTQIMLVVESDWPELARVRVSFERFESPPVDIALAHDARPRTLALAHDGGPKGPIGVRVSGYLAGSDVPAIVEPRTGIYFVENETRMLRIPLRVACTGACADTEACLIDRRSQATCHAPDGLSNLEPWTGPIPNVPLVPVAAVARPGEPSELVDAGGLPTIVDEPSSGPLGSEGGARTGQPTVPASGGGAEPDAWEPADRQACVGTGCPDVCVAGFGDCDGDVSNGCETDLSQHCGPCGARTGYQKLLTVPAGTVADDLEGFPVLVALDDPDLAKASDSGLDLCFAGSDGATPLPFEVERWDRATGTLRAWVRLTQLSAGQAQTLRLYYGDGQEVSREAATMVWDDDYLAVMHLADPGDSKQGFMGTGQDYSHRGGLVGSAISFDPATAGYLELMAPELDDLFVGGGTIEAWFFTEGGNEGDLATILDKSTGSAIDTGWSLFLTHTRASATGLAFGVGRERSALALLAPALPPPLGAAVIAGRLLSSGAELWTLEPDDVTPRRWHHVAITYDTDWALLQPATLYVDGVPLPAAAVGGSGLLEGDSGAPLRIGNANAGDRPFHGMIDEVRISRSVRSPAWIAASVLGQRDPSTFLIVGPETLAP